MGEKLLGIFGGGGGKVQNRPVSTVFVKCHTPECQKVAN